jgi:hypothetical protein
MVIYLFGWKLQAQDDLKLQLIKKIDVQSRFIEIDKLQQLYIVTDDHTLQKYSPDGELLKYFNENNIGAISSIDVTNPFQPLVYYGEYQIGVMLDRSLSEIFRFKLGDLNLYQIDAVGLSSDNLLWLYDPNSFKLKKIDKNLRTVTESLDLTGILEESFLPVKLIESDNKVFLFDPDYGLMIFDLMGNYLKTIKNIDAEFIQIQDNELHYLDSNNKLNAFKISNLQKKQIDLKSKEIESDHLIELKISIERLFLMYNDRVDILKK